MQCTPPAVEDCLSDPAKACATCQVAPNALKCATCATAGWFVNPAGVVSATQVQHMGAACRGYAASFLLRLLLRKRACAQVPTTLKPLAWPPTPKLSHPPCSTPASRLLLLLLHVTPAAAVTHPPTHPSTWPAVCGPQRRRGLPPPQLLLAQAARPVRKVCTVQH